MEQRGQDAGSIFASPIYLRLKQYLNEGHNMTEQDWRELTDIVNATYTGFTDKLYSLYRMSEQDLRVSLLIKVRIQPKDIATLTAHSKESMIEYFLANMWQVWAIVAIVCLILELSSGDFFIICLSIGGVFALIGAALGINVYWQLFIFAIFSLLSIFFVRPVALRWLHKNEPNKASNADALLGRTGRVTEEIKVGGNGYVQIDGDMWKAVSQKDIAVGETVRVIGRESTIITVDTL